MLIGAMNLLFRIRRSAATWSRVNLALFALVWLSIVIAPCAMVMEAQASPSQHDCPHCPPQPCHEAASDQCDEPDSIDSPRLSDPGQWVLAPATRAMSSIAIDTTRASFSILAHSPPARAGPRIHLVHVRFHE